MNACKITQTSKKEGFGVNWKALNQFLPQKIS